METTEMVIIYPAYMHHGSILAAQYLHFYGANTYLIGIERPWDGKISKKTLNQLSKFLKKLSPQMLGISNIYMPKNWQEEIKEELEVLIIASGYATDVRMSKICRADEPIDLAILGTPHSLPDFIKRYKKGEKVEEFVHEFSNILFKDGINIKKDAKVEIKKECFIPEEMSELPHLWISKNGEKKKPNINDSPILDMYGCDYGKCIFCVESCRKPSLITFSKEEYKKLLKRWDEIYPSKCGFIISENPVRKFDEIVRECSKTVDLDYFIFFSRVNNLVKNKEKLEEGIKICKENGSGCVNHLLGFESFKDEDLKILKKPTTMKTNLNCVYILRELKKKYPGNFEYRQPVSHHGLILGLPWRRLEDIVEEFRILEKYELWDIFSPDALSTTLHIHGYNERLVNIINRLQEKGKVNIEYIDEYGIYHWSYNDEKMNYIFSELKDIAKKYKEDKFSIVMGKNRKKWKKFLDISQDLSQGIIKSISSLSV